MHSKHNAVIETNEELLAHCLDTGDNPTRDERSTISKPTLRGLGVNLVATKEGSKKLGNSVDGVTLRHGWF
jgi:hypothetical protein